MGASRFNGLCRKRSVFKVATRNRFRWNGKVERNKSEKERKGWKLGLKCKEIQIQARFGVFIFSRYWNFNSNKNMMEEI